MERLERWLSVKSLACSSRGPGLDSQTPHGSSQSSVIPVLRNLTPSSSLCRNSTCMVFRHTFRQHTHTQYKKREQNTFPHILMWVNKCPIFFPTKEIYKHFHVFIPPGMQVSCGQWRGGKSHEQLLGSDMNAPLSIPRPTVPKARVQGPVSGLSQRHGFCLKRKRMKREGSSRFEHPDVLNIMVRMFT